MDSDRKGRFQTFLDTFDFKLVNRGRRKADPKIGEIKLDGNQSLA